MDAIEFKLQQSKLARIYFVFIYMVLVYFCYLRFEKASNFLIAVSLLVLLLCFDWRRYCLGRYGFGVRTVVNRFRYSEQQWRLYSTGEWQNVELCVAQRILPIFIRIVFKDDSGKTFRVGVWRDSLLASEWKKLQVYLSV